MYLIAELEANKQLRIVYSSDSLNDIKRMCKSIVATNVFIFKAVALKDLKQNKVIDFK